MRIISFPEKSTWPDILTRPVQKLDTIEKSVQPILDAVKEKGDVALREFSLKFDRVELTQVEILNEEINRAESLLDPELIQSINQAYSNIFKFHSAQKQPIEIIETMPGVSCWRKSVGIEKVGIYIPGGSAPLFSTVLMLAIPAQLAGCKDIVLCTPSDHPAILYAAKLTGVTRIFRVGGAQAIAAMAYGTESIPKTYKIFGPGNQYVTTAKMLLAKEGVAIDMPAGPSEVAIIADHTAVPAFIASDLLSQAEHGPDSQVLLVTTDEVILEKVNLELEKQLAALPRQDIARQAMANSQAVLVADQTVAMEMINEYAPEHLIICTANADELAEKVINAGSIFIGNYTPESCGDYASGTNHTLPTNGYAKAYSGVSLDSFVKKITMQKITEQGINTIGPIVAKMAEAETLDAHKRAVTIRMEALNN